MTIQTCANCGQRNRLPDTTPAGKMVICGQCKERLDDDLEDVDDDDDDEAT